MSKILFIGDPHLRANDFEQSVTFLHWVEDVVAKEKPDILCNLGDTFHNHAILRSELLKEFKDHIERTISIMSNQVFNYWYVLGNHDQYKPKDSKYHALQSFDIEGFTVFDKIVHPNREITVVPYLANFEDFPTNTHKIVITHNTFIGADYGFKREDCGINADKVNADIIISGHIHKRQSFGKVVYPGTPYSHNANDVGETKGLLLFDTATYEQTFIESPFTKWRSLDFTVGKYLSIDELHDMLGANLDDVNKWILKISGPKLELSTYFQSKKYLDLVLGKSVVLKLMPSDAEKQSRIQIKSSSDNDIISEYVAKIYNGSADKSLIIHKAQEILKNL